MRILTLLLSTFLLSACAPPVDRKVQHNHLRNFLNICDERKGVKAFFIDEFRLSSDHGPELYCNDGSYFNFRVYLQQLPDKVQQ